MTLDEAITQFGSVSEIADSLRISVQAVYKWGDTVPPLRIYQLREIAANKAQAPKASAAA